MDTKYVLQALQKQDYKKEEEALAAQIHTLNFTNLITSTIYISKLFRWFPLPQNQQKESFVKSFFIKNPGFYC